MAEKLIIEERPAVKPFYKSLTALFTTTHHTDIGLLYMWTGFLNFILAGVSALLMRWELANPGQDIVSNDVYASLFTVHGTAMVFLAIPIIGVGLGNYLVPKLVGAPDMYWPKINALSYWLVPVASAFVWLGFPAIGWTAYPPLSVITPGIGVDMWILGLHLVGASSILSALNFLMTIWRLRAPSVTFRNLSLFVWSIIAMSLLIVFAIPPLAVALTFLLLDRNLGTNFFIPEGGGDPILWQHLFWFLGHPEVYILVLPAMGLVSEIVSRMSRKPIYGYWAIAVSSMLITALSFGVWAHHMFTTGLSITARIPFMAMTMAIAIPSGIKVFNWLATMYGGRIKLKIPMLFAVSFIASFIVGGVTGVFFPVIPVDYAFQDTYFVVGHFHFVVLAIFNALFAAVYYYFPYMTGRMYSEKLAYVHFVGTFIGQLLTFTSFLVLGVLGMPRRYYDYLPEFRPWHFTATIGAALIGAGVIAFVYNVFWSMRKGHYAKVDPWDSAKYGLPDFPEVTVAAPR